MRLSSMARIKVFLGRQIAEPNATPAQTRLLFESPHA